MAFAAFIPLIQAGISALGGAASNWMNAGSNKANRKWSEEMWEKNNEYNLPVNQIQRFKDAGLNPALAYGDGTSTLASYAGNMQANRSFNNPITYDTANALIQKKLADVQEVVGTSEAVKNQSEADKNASITEGQEWDNIIKARTFETAIETSLQNLEKLKNENLISAQEYMNKKEEYNKILEQVREARENANRAAEAVETQKALTRETQTAADLNVAKTGTEATVQSLNKKQGEYYDAAAYNQKQQGKLAGAEALRALENAKTEAAIREKLKSETSVNKENVNLLVKMGVKTEAEARKLLSDMEQAVKNGDVDRFIRTTTQRYGTSTLGAAAGIIMDELGIHPGTQTVGSYGKDKFNQKVGNSVIKNIDNEMRKKGYYRAKDGKYYKRK